MFGSKKKTGKAPKAPTETVQQPAAPTLDTGMLNGPLNDMIAMVNPDSQPNVNALWMELKERNAIKWSVKQQGYAIGR